MSCGLVIAVFGLYVVVTNAEVSRPWYAIPGAFITTVLISALVVWQATQRIEVDVDGITSRDLWLRRKIYWHEAMAIYASDGQSFWVVAPKSDRKIKKITVWAGLYDNGDTLARATLARQYLAQPLVFVSPNLEKSYGFPPVGVPVSENSSEDVAST